MKYIITLCICILCAFSLSAQDRLVTLQGDEIVGKIMIVDTAFVHYALKDTTADTLAYSKEMHKLRIADIFMITYANGSKEVFTQNLPEEKNENENTVNKNMAGDSDNYLRGQQDAKALFDGNGAFIAGFIGLIPGAIVAVTPPAVKQSRVSDPELMNDASYIQGYKKAASNKKLKNAAAGYAVGRVVTLVFFIAIALSI